MSTQPLQVLIVNPNTSQHMTDALKPVVEGLGFTDVQFSYFTSPTPGVPSINSPSDAAESATICLQSLIAELPHHDAFLIACYSQHPLVPQLQAEIDRLNETSGLSLPARKQKHVTGIFEASVHKSLQLVSSSSASSTSTTGSQDKTGSGSGSELGFGIVSTGKIWESGLSQAITSLFSAEDAAKFISCETTGLNATELHELPAAQVAAKMKEATQKLLRKGIHERKMFVRAVCLGCAGMVGLEDTVREACVAELGEERAKTVAIVDGVVEGVRELVALGRGHGHGQDLVG